MSVPDHRQDPWTRVRTLHDFPADEVISSLQKEVRRGNLENAALLAYEMVTTSAEMEAYLWERLQVIAVEDVGFGAVQAPILIETLFQQHNRLARPRHDRYLFATHAVRYLCTCQKERGSDHLLNWLARVTESGDVLPTIPDYAIDMHTRRGQEMGRSVEHFLKEASQVAPQLPDSDTVYYHRLIELLRNSTEA